eukprot:CAMPEP_0172622404 /NCGR_PEP_ID=MMETSP1068-20121228/120018_1 /TAXON_ID=35684 /ORGANISM="Pseudopedinella elastica, Strain CCMP716" /LENGTH=45 /DNA_ID= /DNA_START= /DNA_END= /DNA_ORIENTATION=
MARMSTWGTGDSDGETSPAPTASSDDKFRAASPAALVTSDGKPPK